LMFSTLSISFFTSSVVR